MSDFGTAFDLAFLLGFGLVNPIGEPSQEETRTEGETLQGRTGIFAVNVCIPGHKVSFCGSVASLRCAIRRKRRPACGCRNSKGEQIREQRIGRVSGTSKLPGLPKGETFREVFERLWTAEVRKYRINLAAVARKSPTDAA